MRFENDMQSGLNTRAVFEDGDIFKNTKTNEIFTLKRETDDSKITSNIVLQNENKKVYVNNVELRTDFKLVGSVQ